MRILKLMAALSAVMIAAAELLELNQSIPITVNMNLDN